MWMPAVAMAATMPPTVSFFFADEYSTRAVTTASCPLCSMAKSNAPAILTCNVLSLGVVKDDCCDKKGDGASL